MNRKRKRNIALEIRATLIADLIFPSNMEDIEREKKAFPLKIGNERVLKYISLQNCDAVFRESTLLNH